MGVGSQGDLAHPPQELAKGRIATQVTAQHQGVEEAPDEILSLGPNAASDRRADQQILLTRVTAEHVSETPRGASYRA